MADIVVTRQRRGNTYMEYANSVDMTVDFEMPAIVDASRLIALVYRVRTALTGAPTGFDAQERYGDWPNAVSEFWQDLSGYVIESASNEVSFPHVPNVEGGRLYMLAGMFDDDSDLGAKALGGARRWIWEKGTVTVGVFDIAQYWIPY